MIIGATARLSWLFFIFKKHYSVGHCHFYHCFLLFSARVTRYGVFSSFLTLFFRAGCHFLLWLDISSSRVGTLEVGTAWYRCFLIFLLREKLHSSMHSRVFFCSVHFLTYFSFQLFPPSSVSPRFVACLLLVAELVFILFLFFCFTYAYAYASMVMI